MNSYDEILVQPKTYSKQDVQKLVDYAFAIAIATFENHEHYKKTFNKEQYMLWVAQNLREGGFDTQPKGSSWGVLK